MLNTSPQDKLCKQSCIMMIMGDSKMSEIKYDLKAIMYPAYDTPHKLCNIRHKGKLRYPTTQITTQYSRQIHASLQMPPRLTQVQCLQINKHNLKVSLQFSCDDTCQIWMWFKECNRYFCEIKNFAYGEIDERSFSNPTLGLHHWLHTHTQT